MEVSLPHVPDLSAFAGLSLCAAEIPLAVMEKQSITDFNSLACVRNEPPVLSVSKSILDHISQSDFHTLSANIRFLGSIFFFSCTSHSSLIPENESVLDETIKRASSPCCSLFSCKWTP